MSAKNTGYFQRHNFVDTVGTILHETGVDCHDIVPEAAEGIAIQDLQQVKRVVDKLCHSVGRMMCVEG